MRPLRVALTRLAGIFNKDKRDLELAQEIESHIQLHTDDNVNCGMDLGEARREALIRLGGVEQTKELYRERRGLPMIETLLQDLRFGARMLRKNAGFTVVAVLTLALSIGANTAIFSVIYAVLLRPLPYKNSDQLVSIATDNVQRGVTGLPVSFTKMTRVKEQSRTLQSIGAFFPVNASLTTHGSPEQVSAARATAGFFDVLGVIPAEGRGFLPEEDGEGGADVAIISDGFWHSHFGAAPDLIGRAIPLDGKSVTVVGVLPASFHFPFAQPEPDVWLPRVFDPVALTPTMIRTALRFSPSSRACRPVFRRRSRKPSLTPSTKPT